jgi:hypothetical protein
MTRNEGGRLVSQFKTFKPFKSFKSSEGKGYQGK